MSVILLVRHSLNGSPRLSFMQTGFYSLRE